jgi:integrase
LLVETDIETGLRWGELSELSELRVKDINFATRMLTVSRAMVEVSPEFHPTGDRFLVKDYPKDREYRQLKLTEQITDKLKAYIGDHGLADDDLLFLMQQPKTQIRGLPDPDTLGRTEPNAAGHTYKHGTPTAYTLGRCRCQHCRDASAVYRANAAPRAKTGLPRSAHARPTATSRPTGSATRYGNPP